MSITKGAVALPSPLSPPCRALRGLRLLALLRLSVGAAAAVPSSTVPPPESPATNFSCARPLLARAGSSALAPKEHISKIFFIGMHKTGTTTYAALCRAANFSTLHGGAWFDSSSSSKKARQTHDCFADFGEDPDTELLPAVQNLVKEWPEARFVLNTRPLLSWVVSVLDHTTAANKRCECSERWDRSRTKEERVKWGTAAYIQRIVERRSQYHQDVLHYFGSDERLASRLLVADVTTQPHEELVGTLAAFMGRAGLAGAMLYLLGQEAAGLDHISLYHDPSSSFIEKTLHLGNTAEAMASLASLVDGENQGGALTGIRGCPKGLIAV